MIAEAFGDGVETDDRKVSADRKQDDARAMSSGGSFSSLREIATASAGSAQISRATLRASASVWPGATTTLTKPAA